MTIKLPAPDIYGPDQDTGQLTASYSEDLVNGIVEAQQMAFWDAYSLHGKVGEVIYMTYKAKRDAKEAP